MRMFDIIVTSQRRCRRLRPTIESKVIKGPDLTCADGTNSTLRPEHRDFCSLELVLSDGGIWMAIHL
jgi:hypothetical protein